MATANTLTLDLSEKDAGRHPLYRRIGLLNGLFIGLALGLGVWGLEALRIISLPFQLYLPTLALGIVLVTIICALAGWLTARAGRTWLTVLAWFGAAVVCMLFIGYLAYQGRTLLVWLADGRFWGREVYPNVLGGTPGGLILGGFLIILVLLVLGLVQGYRLENITNNLGGKTRLDGRAWFALLLPVPFVFLAGLITKNVMDDPAAQAGQIAYQVIERVNSYDGDLDQLSRQEGINYAALTGVRDEISDDYTLGIGEVSPANSTVAIVADFANGAWVYCRVVNAQMNFCYDASLPYTIGLRSLLTGEPLPDPCRGCLPQNASDWRAWLSDQGERLGPEPRIERLAQWGSHVLMRAESASGDEAIECWFEGITRVNIAACENVAAQE